MDNANVLYTQAKHYEEIGRLKANLDFASTSETAAIKKRINSPLHTLVDYHVILGHIPIPTIRNLMKGDVIPSIQWTEEDIRKVEECQESTTVKAIRKLHNNKTTRTASRILERLHMDLFEPKVIRNSKYYFPVIRDGFSGYIWTYKLAHKNESATFVIFQKLVKQLKNKFPDNPIVEIRSDGGTEFFNSSWNEFLKEQGIKWNEIPPYTPEKNRLAEKTNHLLNLIPLSCYKYNSSDEVLR